MRIRVENKLPGDLDYLVVTRVSGSDTVPAGLDEKTTALVNKVKEIGGAEKYLETETVLYTDGGPAKRLVVVGTGKDFDVASARKLAQTVTRSLRKKGGKRMAFAFQLPASANAGDLYQALAEGVVHSTFEPGFYYTGENKDEKVLEDVIFLGGSDGDIKDRVDRGVVIGEGINLSRYLANETPNVMFPERLAEEAEKVAKETGLEFHALDKAQLTEGGFKAILAVGQGSIHEPAHDCPEVQRGRGRALYRRGRQRHHFRQRRYQHQTGRAHGPHEDGHERRRLDHRHYAYPGPA